MTDHHCPTQSEAEAALLPCPFCGGPGTRVYVRGVDYAGCHNKDCPVHPKAGSTDMNLAIRRWNTRSAVATADAELNSLSTKAILFATDH